MALSRLSACSLDRRSACLSPGQQPLRVWCEDVGSGIGKGADGSVAAHGACVSWVTTAYAHWCYVVGHVLCRCILSAGLPGMSFLPHASSPEPPAPVQGWYLASPEGVTIATHSTNTRAFSGPKSGGGDTITTAVWSALLRLPPSTSSL